MLVFLCLKFDKNYELINYRQKMPLILSFKKLNLQIKSFQYKD